MVRYALVLLLALGACAPAKRRVTTPARPVPGRWHRVVAGDTVALIAERFHVPIADVEEINGVDRRDPLVLGRLIFLPHARHPSSRPAATASSRPDTNASSQPAPTASSASLRWPVTGGVLTSAFGRRGKRVHEGIDIGAREGTPVLAAAAGKVIYAGSGLKGYGHMVILQHNKGGLVSVYAHNKRNLVREGQELRAGEVLAEVGNTGRSTGYHVHFEVRQGDKPVDPLRYLRVPTRKP